MKALEFKLDYKDLENVSRIRRGITRTRVLLNARDIKARPRVVRESDKRLTLAECILNRG